MKRLKYLNYIIFFLLELILLVIIIFLTVKILDLRKEKVKGIQYVSVIKKKDLIFDSEDKQLKYFYEPRPKSISILNPEWLGYKVKNTINADSLNKPVSKFALLHV